MSTAITRTGGGFAIAPANMSELFSFAKLIAESDLVPKDYRDKPGNCMVAIQMGGELGLSPMQSIQNIAVINGRPSLWGDALLAVCLPHLDEFEETDDGAAATCRAVRGKRSVTATFSMEDAKRAGLAGKSGPWSQYPARMRKMRARSFALRDICADVLRGIHSAEETQDIPREAVRAEVTSSKPAEPEKPKDERKSTPPPAAAAPEGPKFSIAFPNATWNGLAMEDATPAVLEEYMQWCQGVSENLKLKKSARDNALVSKALAEAAFERMMQREAAEAERAAESADPVADALEKDVERGRSTGEDASDHNSAWGLEPG